MNYFTVQNLISIGSPRIPGPWKCITVKFLQLKVRDVNEVIWEAWMNVKDHMQVTKGNLSLRFALFSLWLGQFFK